MKKWIIIISGLSLCISSYAQFDVPPESVGNKNEVKRILSNAFCPSSIPESDRAFGKIFLTFIINEDGSVEQLSFAKGLSPKVDQEIERIFPLLQWQPGLIDGEPVRAEHLFQFKINSKFYQDSALCMKTPIEKVIPYEEANQKPLFLYGELSKWIYDQLEYPNLALSQGIEGMVRVRFVIETNGELSNIGIDKSVGGGCDEEAIRVIKLTKWIPGRVDGSPVRTQIFYPITFSIKGGGFNEVHGSDMIKGR